MATFIQKIIDAILGAVFFVPMLLLSLFLKHSYSVKISGPLTLDERWSEFHQEKGLKADKDWQEIGLKLEQPYSFDFFGKGTGSNKGQGILMPDGDVINPEIEVIDQFGNVFSLVFSGARVSGSGKGGTVLYHKPYPQKFPRDRVYETVRIRSPRQISCKAIYWFCMSRRDMK
jgi:hypothetical protein